jgi:hypothetical protein
LDGIEPKELSGAFDMALETARESGVLEDYRVLKERYRRRWTGHGIFHQRRYIAATV